MIGVGMLVGIRGEQWAVGIGFPTKLPSNQPQVGT